MGLFSQKSCTSIPILPAKCASPTKKILTYSERIKGNMYAHCTMYAKVWVHPPPLGPSGSYIFYFFSSIFPLKKNKGVEPRGGPISGSLKSIIFFTVSFRVCLGSLSYSFQIWKSNHSPRRKFESSYPWYNRSYYMAGTVNYPKYSVFCSYPLRPKIYLIFGLLPLEQIQCFRGLVAFQTGQTGVVN